MTKCDQCDATEDLEKVFVAVTGGPDRTPLCRGESELCLKCRDAYAGSLEAVCTTVVPFNPPKGSNKNSFGA